MDELILEVFPASFGDCFLISYNGKHILVDCGFIFTYRKYLKEKQQYNNYC